MGTPAAPTEGQVVIYAQNGSLKSVSHGGTPSALATFPALFQGSLYVEFPEFPSTDYYFSKRDVYASSIFPLATNVVITSAAVYATKSSAWNVPLSVRVARGNSEAAPVVGDELLEMPVKTYGDRGDYEGTVYTATGLNISAAESGYLTVAFRPVTEEPGDVGIEANLQVVLMISPA